MEEINEAVLKKLRILFLNKKVDANLAEYSKRSFYGRGGIALG